LSLRRAISKLSVVLPRRLAANITSNIELMTPAKAGVFRRAYMLELTARLLRVA
jgi:hypothetical protein